MIRVIPTTSPQDVKTEELVNRLRADVIPKAVKGTGLTSHVPGRHRGCVGGLHELLVRADAAVLRHGVCGQLPVADGGLSIAARSPQSRDHERDQHRCGLRRDRRDLWLGMVRLSTRHRTGSDRTLCADDDVCHRVSPIDGLKVFLLSRIEEEYERHGEPRKSVADGLAATAQVITAAAAIMVVVFGSFMFEDSHVTRLFGMGLATAVLLDATLVRMLLVPATMELLGERNWWLPGWLDRILPRLDIEGHSIEPGVATPDSADASNG